MKKLRRRDDLTVGLAPITMIASALRAFGKGCGDRAGADILQQRCRRRRMAKPCAVIDIVPLFKAGRDQLLHKIGLLIAALRRSKPRHCGWPSASRIAARRPAARSSASSHPASRKCVSGLAGSKGRDADFGISLAPDQRRWHRPFRAGDIIKEASGTP